MTTSDVPAPHRDPAYRAALKFSAVLNAVMVIVQGATGLLAGSAALVADAADFLEDVFGYTFALVGLNWGPRARAWAGLAQAAAMALAGLGALYVVLDRFLADGLPVSQAMGLGALLALAVNLACAWRLSRHRSGDASIRAVWLSTRNDALMNGLVFVAAVAVAQTGRGWPDLLAGAVIAAVNLRAAGQVARLARGELAGA